MNTIGTCSKCGGAVQVPVSWGSTIPPVPTCATCGATAKASHGPVIPTEVDPKMIPKSPMREPEKRTVYITKYALTQGVYPIEVVLSTQTHAQPPSWATGAYVYGGKIGEMPSNYRLGKDAFLNREAALADAEYKRVCRIKALEREIEKLHSLAF